MYESIATIPTDIFLVMILGIHYVSDFLLQTRQMGENKGKSWKWLSIHVGVYTASLIMGMILVSDSFQFALTYSLLNGALHFMTDAITARISGYFYLKSLENKTDKPNWMYFFWSTIGLDQLIHASTLILTLRLFI